MKTAKEITEYLTKEYQHNEDMNIHLVYIQHPEGYDDQLEMLQKMRKWLLEYEYYPGTKSAMKGIEDALRWILEEEKK